MSIQQHQPGWGRHRADCKCGCDRQALAAAGVLNEPEVRSALGRRDIATLFQLLQHYGFSQRRIAAMTGQSQSQISEILNGRRAVVSYDLLLRIADGLGAPRGWMGLAYDTPPAEPAHG